jgi:hypothetical protein
LHAQWRPETTGETALRMPAAMLSDDVAASGVKKR